MLSKLEEEKEGDVSGAGGNGKSSLKDRFKMIRMREEAGIAGLPGEDNKAATGALGSPVGKSLGLGVVSPIGDDKEHNLAVQQPPTSPVPPSPNPSLAPGTASGVSAGPSAISDVPVDWDLWQSVITEGPAAVARTDAEELNKALATGIPSAIRGVIWQVLAQSKNDELEVVYRELVERGTDKEKDRHSNGAASLSGVSSLGGTQKETVSAASSVHSEQSGANGASLPADKDTEASSVRAQAAAAAERKKKDKEDALMLQKLEKVIRRDLGTRTSYSKFAAAQGLQEGLFGVCKAYALFDEGVGYAQGMNFLIMPLLFNVSARQEFLFVPSSPDVRSRCPRRRPSACSFA